MKRGLAVFLAVLLMIPSMPVWAEELPAPTAVTSEDTGENGIKDGTNIPEGEGEKPDEENGDETPDVVPDTSPVKTEEPLEPDTTPDTTESPAVPETTPDSGETGSPVPTEAPEATATPETSEVPDKTAVPETSKEPGASATPGVTALPSASASSEATATATATPSATASPSATPLLDISEADEILFNTGNHIWSVVTKEAFDQEMGDAFYEEDGSYTINIPEENPFFPYEVQFTCDGETENKWFMAPDDSVEIGGHTFYVSAYFDGTEVTQMSLNVAGDTVIVWPEEKEFTDEEDGGAEELSLLPLTEKNLTVNLSDYTPADLTMVSVDSIFTGSDTLQNKDKVAWTYTYEDDYTISESGSKIDLSRNTGYSSVEWQMIVGDADQLTDSNTRYIIRFQLTSSDKWLTPTVYIQDDAGMRSAAIVSEYDYDDYRKESRELEFTIPSSNMGSGATAYVSLNVNPSVFGSTRFSSYKVYEGQFSSATEAMSGTDITSQICNINMDQRDAGYAMAKYGSQWITMVTYDSSGQVTGCLPFRLYFRTVGNGISIGLYEKDGTFVVDSRSGISTNGCVYETMTLYQGNAANESYYLTMNYYETGVQSSSDVTAAYVGQYTSMAEAASAGAMDIKNTLFKSISSGGGYVADYSQGVYFTVFVGTDSTPSQEVYKFNIKVEEGTNPYRSLYSGTIVWFTGIKDGAGNHIDSYVASYDDDSYSENNYITILVEPTVDLTNLAPEFHTSSGVNLYTAGSSATEISGVSRHDFSQGAVQYTAGSEDGNNQRNYWVQVVKASSGAGQLYLNSLADKEANTRVENGVTYSIRQVMLDGYHDYIHDILLINTGTSSIPALSVELASDAVQLDEYWTLNGNRELSGFTTTSKTTSKGELPNLAKIRLKAKEGMADGTEVSGTLTIKSAGNTLMVLTLTGTIGDPCIITDEIPQAVKYVPYGAMIQNNNKYSWNQVSYRLLDGTLPGGMIVKPNGEVYGVPREAGEFTFTVEMRNSQTRFKSSIKTYTLTVLENTDPNVDGATDTGYDLSQRVRNISASSQSALGGLELPVESRTLVSQGIYGEFVDIYLDGVKLVEGTDYTSESGSTRITILTQTLARRSTGTHTLGVEFRTSEDELKRAAQNYLVEVSGEGANDPNDNDSSGEDEGGNSEGDGSDNDESSSDSSATIVNASGLNGAGRGNVANTNASESLGNTENTVIYTVEAGDSLWKIAEKFYGDGSFWRKIYAENASVIGTDPNKIQVGMVLTIYLNQGDGSMITSVSEDGTTGNSYIVQRDDTLWKIALKVYGRGWRWRRIYEANADKISDPGQIYVGQVLFIPE